MALLALSLFFSTFAAQHAHAQTELIVNGGFESGLSNWTAFWGTGIQATLTTYPHTGSHYAYLQNNSNSGGIYQNVTIPANTVSATLSFWYNVSSSETTTSAIYDDFYVMIYDSTGNTQLALVKRLTNLDKANAGAYTRVSFDLLPYHGQTIGIRMNGQNDGSNPTTFRIDDVSIQVATETIASPGGISGEPSPILNSSYTYTVGASSSSLGHTLQYSFNWGDGASSPWVTSQSASHAWTSTGQKTIVVTARCQTHMNVSANNSPGNYVVVKTANLRPSLTSIATPAVAQSGDVPISYTLADAESDTCGIAVEYSPDGGSAWHGATAGSGGDGAIPLTSSPVGTAHTFVWASGSDIVNANMPAVRFRITPVDAGGVGTSGTTGTFAVNNTTVTLVVRANTTTSYGSLLIGGTMDLTFNVSNVGTHSISGSASIAVPFYIVSGGSYALAPGQSIATTIRYAPVEAGNNVATATFIGGSGTTLTLTGLATADPTSGTGAIAGQMTRADTHAALNNVMITAVGPRGSSSTRSGVIGGQDGRYLISNLPVSDHYQVLATAGGQQFQTAELDDVAVVVGQTTGRNIELTPSDQRPNPTPENTPVVLVRGYGPVQEWDSGDNDHRESNYWARVRSALQASGFANVWDCNQPEADIMEGSGHAIIGTNGIAYNAYRLKYYLWQKSEKYKSVRGYYAPEIHIVAHSMGGLIVRAALGDDEQFDFWGGSPSLKVGKVIMLATPHCGSPVADYAQIKIDNWLLGGLAESMGGRWESTANLTTSAMQCFNTAHHNWPSVPLYLLSASGGYHSSDTSLYFGSAVIGTMNEAYGFDGTDEDINDGVVTKPCANGIRWHRPEWTYDRCYPVYQPCRPETNVLLNAVQSIADSDLGRSLDHCSLLKDSAVTNWIVNTLVNPNPAPTLPLINSFAKVQGGARLDEEVSEQSAVPNQVFESLDGTVTNGGMVAVSVASDAMTTLTFQLMASDTNIIFRLNDPSGTLIDATTPQAITNVQYEASAIASNLLLAMFTITNPTGGVWTAVVDASSSTTTQADYSLMVSGDSNVGLIPQTANLIGQGQNAVVSCLLADLSTNPVVPVSNAVVTATIQLPDGTTNSLSLFDDGWHNDCAPNDGVFAAVLANVEQAGTYSIAYRAIGTNSQGQALQRIAIGTFSVSTGNGSILGEPSYERVDTDGDGYADFLIVKVWVNPTVAGNYILSGQLAAAANLHNFAKSTQFSADGTGPMQVTLIFNLAEMRAAGSQGTYHIENLQLFEVTDSGTAWLDAYKGASTVEINGPNAIDPSPKDQETDVPRTAVLQWADGGGAFSYDVFIGTNAASLIFQTNQTETTFDPGVLALGTTYYWRVDAQNAEGTAQGDIWSFTTTPPFLYELNGNGIDITRYIGDGGSVSIPSVIDGLPVNGISGWAFQGCVSVTDIAIPPSISFIGNCAFCDCTGLREIAIPDTVIQFGDSAFCNCTALANAVIGNGVMEIARSTFEGCYGLTNVVFGINVTQINDMAFAGCNSLGSIKVPDSVMRIGRRAFSGMGYFGSQVVSSLTNVVFGSGVTDIDSEAFFHCDSLVSVTIPDNVVRIGNSAFDSCFSLAYVTIGNGVSDIGMGAFWNCRNLRSIVIGDCITSMSGWLPNWSGDLENLANVVIGKGVTSIPDGTFRCCYNLTNVVIGTGVKTIGTAAFAGCVGLTSVIIPDNVTSIGNSAFDGRGENSDGGPSCLSNVLIGAGVTDIGDGAFRYCSGLPRITIPDNVRRIGDFAFDSCTGLTAVVIGNGVTDVGYGAFSFCSALFDMTIGSNVINIANYTFYGCTNLANLTILNSEMSGFQAYRLFDGGPIYSLTNVVIGAGVNTIGEAAFWPCFGLKSVTIPDSVTSIGESAFEDCTSLTSVTLPANIANIGAYAFAFCESLTNITVDPGNMNYCSVDGVLYNKEMTEILQYPGGRAGCYSIRNGVINIGTGAFINCVNLTDVSIPDSVAYIGEAAFNRCFSLNCYFKGNAPAFGSWTFYGADNVTVFYCPGTTGWDATFDGVPAVLLPYTYTADGDTVTITAYAGTNAVEVIPSSIEGKPVTVIGDYAFFNCTTLAGVTIPDGVTSIGDSGFENCTGLTSVLIPNSVTNIGASAFENCTSLAGIALPAGVTGICDAAFFNCARLTGVTIPDGVTGIGNWAFASCDGLVSVTLPACVRHIGNYAFGYCPCLSGVYFKGDAPDFGLSVLTGSGGAAIFRLPVSAGWSQPVAGRPPIVWNPGVSTGAGFGMRSEGFGFTVTGTNSMAVAVEASTNLAGAVWVPVETVTLSNGAAAFTDTASTNLPARFYRFHMP